MGNDAADQDGIEGIGYRYVPECPAFKGLLHPYIQFSWFYVIRARVRYCLVFVFPVRHIAILFRLVPEQKR